MELIDLINHVKANVESDKLPYHGLTFMGEPCKGVNLNYPEKYSLENSAGEKLLDQYIAEFSHRYPTVGWSLLNNAERECWQWLAEREQTLKAQADAWETVWDKLRDVCGLKFGSYNGTGSQIAIQAIDDLVARVEGKIIHVKLPTQAMTGEQFYNEVWKPQFVGILMNEYKELAITTQSAMETAARLISPRKLTGRDIIQALNFLGVKMTKDQCDTIAHYLNAK